MFRKQKSNNPSSPKQTDVHPINSDHNALAFAADLFSKCKQDFVFLGPVTSYKFGPYS